MDKEIMSVHRGLAELKLLDARINRAVIEGRFVTHNKRSNSKIDGMEIQDYKNKVIKSSYDKVEGLIRRRKSIKSAIVKSNALTMIDIAGVTMSVAEAIDRKSSIEYEVMFLENMKAQYARALSLIENNNNSLTKRADEQINILYQNKDNVDPNKINALRADFINENTFDLIDPLDIKDKIDKMEREIDDFITEVDFKLSESNALTMIEIL